MIIRKISVGPDSFKSMNYVIGQDVLDKTYMISQILHKEYGYDIWILKNFEEVKWKTISIHTPVVIEYKIDF